MRHIIAFIKPNMLDDVIFALHEMEDFPGAGISETLDICSGSRSRLNQGDRTPFRGFPKAIRMEIVCMDEQTEAIVETIRQNAYTGLPDDGRIFLSTVDDAIRICTGERGEDVLRGM